MQQTYQHGAQGNLPPYPPGPNELMAAPAVSSYPRGLQYLALLDQLLIEQKVELTEVFSDIETKNQFKVKNHLGQNVFFALEDSDWCSRQCLGSCRPFELKIFDNDRNEVMHLSRPFRCSLFCCFPSCNNLIEVSAPPGQVIGTIVEPKTWGNPKFHVKDSFGQILFKIVIQGCAIKCCGDVYMEIFDNNKQHIGKITKQWGGLAKEMYTDADSFKLKFPLELDVQHKALLLAAIFLIDIAYYED